jgi:hypothetical protein
MAILFCILDFTILLFYYFASGLHLDKSATHARTLSSRVIIPSLMKGHCNRQDRTFKSNISME